MINLFTIDGNFRRRNGILYFALLLLIIFSLFSPLLHNHSLLESETPDCPMYILSTGSLVLPMLIFALAVYLLILFSFSLLSVCFENSIFISFPLNKSPPFNL